MMKCAEYNSLIKHTCRGSREDMAAMASGNQFPPGQAADQHSTLIEDPDVWRPT